MAELETYVGWAVFYRFGPGEPWRAHELSFSCTRAVAIKKHDSAWLNEDGQPRTPHAARYLYRNKRRRGLAMCARAAVVPMGDDRLEEDAVG